MKIRILLADDHVVLRAGVRMLIEAQPDMTVVGEASDGLEALAQVEKLTPDVLLLDLSMPRLGGLAALGRLRQAVPQTRVLVLTMHEDEEYLRAALQSGAAGYVLKRAAETELLTAIRAVMRGELYLHPGVTRLLLDGMLPTSPLADPWETLSEREKQVLRLVSLGHTSGEIANMLFLSAKTIETYRARGMEKLELRTRAQLVRYVLKQGLMEEM
jgi:two-component system response regulator NreC